eukprot:scaffold376_cov354-Prasinococcus_capsulatus_cf.AAC.8
MQQRRPLWQRRPEAARVRLPWQAAPPPCAVPHPTSGRGSCCRLVAPLTAALPVREEDPACLLSGGGIRWAPGRDARALATGHHGRPEVLLHHQEGRDRRAQGGTEPPGPSEEEGCGEEGHSGHDGGQGRLHAVPGRGELHPDR